MHRRASLAPDTTLYTRLRCVEELSAASTSATPSPTDLETSTHSTHHHQHTAAILGHACTIQTTSFKASNSAMHRRRSLPIRASNRGVVLGQLPVHRRRVPVSDGKLNTAQHPHVAPMLDAKIQMDDRALMNLKDTERESVLVNPHYCGGVQTELQSHHRTTVVEWMHDVLREDAVDEEIYPLSVLILDCFLSAQPVFLRDVQAIASACILMASKLKAPTPLNASRLSFFTDNSSTPKQIINWELVILRVLKWEIALPTAFDFADQLFCRQPALRCLRGQFVRYLYNMQSNLKEAMYKPSIQAAVCLSLAARDARLPRVLEDSLRSMLLTLLEVDMDMALALKPLDGAATFVVPAPVQAPAGLAMLAEVRPKSPPVTPPMSGLDSGFCSAQGTPEAPADPASQLESPF